MHIDANLLTATLIRSTHVLAGIIWLGTVYYLLFIQGPVMARVEPPLRRSMILALMPRALGWLRWSSLITLLLGMVLFVWEYHLVDGKLGNSANLKVDGKVTDRSLLIMTGITAALVLWIVVWFLVWPTWRKILGTLEAGEAPPPSLMGRARVLVRFNAVLSVPMLILMVAPQNYAAPFNGALVTAMIGIGAVLMGLMVWVARR